MNQPRPPMDERFIRIETRLEQLDRSLGVLDGLVRDLSAELRSTKRRFDSILRSIESAREGNADEPGGFGAMDADVER
jgi:hypothetical protein